MPERTLVEITCRTIHGRFLLLPSPLLNQIIIGALARALRRYEVICCGFSFLANHYHLLVVVDDARQLARFMNYFQSKLARETGRLYGWREKVFPRRYQAIVVSNQERAQIGRLKYVLANGCKENLVEHLTDWPGVHAVHALLTGEPLEGLWFDRRREYFARRRGRKVDSLQFSTHETLTLEPLPCWTDLSPQERRKRVAHLVEEIESEAAAERAKTGKSPWGPAAILAQHPHDHPEDLERSPAPLVHASSRAVRHEFRSLYSAFVSAYREAAEKLRRGILDAPFPQGCFPPALPFVGG